MRGWIGVDLDGTLAEYDGWRGVEHVGPPVPAMVERVQQWLAKGRDVRIFTARVASDTHDRAAALAVIERWCLEHLGCVLPVTCQKDYGMVELWDDRAVQVETNTGRPVAKTSEELEVLEAAAALVEGRVSDTWYEHGIDPTASRLFHGPGRDCDCEGPAARLERAVREWRG